MFNTEKFVDDCLKAIHEGEGQAAIRELVAEAVSSPADILRALGEPHEAGFDPIYQGSDLTILNFKWAPQMSLLPHNHNMWAVIGLYTGEEENTFWRRIPGSIEKAGAKSLYANDVATLGTDIIHSVSNPLRKMTCALHIYGGDFFALGRREWDPETFAERPFDVDKSRAAFAQANRRYTEAQTRSAANS